MSVRLQPKSVFGYRQGPLRPRDPARLQIDDEVAHVVREISTWYIEDGLTLYGIAQRLIAHGYRRRVVGGLSWNPTSVRKIPTNATYRSCSRSAAQCTRNIGRSKTLASCCGSMIQASPSDGRFSPSSHSRGVPPNRTFGPRALNHALRGIPQDQEMLHICWGSAKGQHTNDLLLSDFDRFDIECRRGAYSLEAANPRHERMGALDNVGSLCGVGQ